LLFAEILRTLKSAGYKVKVVLINAKFFGVPQSRERMIFVGVREDLQLKPVHPQGMFLPVTVREACAGIETVGVPLEGKLIEMERLTRPGEDFSAARKRMGLSEAYFSTIRLHWNKPAPTICKVMSPGMVGLIHPDQSN